MTTVTIPFLAILLPKKLYNDRLPEFQLPPWIKINTFFFGSRMARKGIVTVVIDYPLSPKATYKEMALASAASVKWVK